MRIVTWNCNGAFRKKCVALDDFNADILVIQECEDPARSTVRYRDWAGEYLWVGKSQNKGIGVFSRSGQMLTALDWNANGLELFLACRIADAINLVGVWTKHAGSPNFRYIGQLWKYLQLNKERLSAEKSILCGDFNSNKQWDEWDRWWNHSDVVRELSEIDMHSLYHLATGEMQGKENSPTLFMYRKLERPYHIDYAFASGSLLGNDGISLSVGKPQKWLEFSDHMPIIFAVAC